MSTENKINVVIACMLIVFAVGMVLESYGVFDRQEEGPEPIRRAEDLISKRLNHPTHTHITLPVFWAGGAKFTEIVYCKDRKKKVVGDTTHVAPERRDTLALGYKRKPESND